MAKIWQTHFVWNMMGGISQHMENKCVFLRHKTRERNEDSSEVIFPIMPEIQKILNKYANKPKLGERVFPIMSKFITPEQEIWVV